MKESRIGLDKLLHKKRKKSVFQKELEKEGWEFLTNEPLCKLQGGGTGYGEDNWSCSSVKVTCRTVNDSGEDLYVNYENNDNFKDVLITYAHDNKGKPAPSLRAIYIKR